MQSATDTDAELLDAIGMRAGSGEVEAACARIVRRIHGERLRVVGFVPVNAKAAVPPVMIQLGLSLCSHTGATVAVVDANVRYPGLAALAKGHAADREGSVFSTRWLRGSLALLSPPRVERAGDVVPQLTRVLTEGAELFAHVLVDLTGFDLLGEHATAAAAMDAVAIVGRAQRTREQELMSLSAAMPRDKFLGVLLVG